MAAIPGLKKQLDSITQSMSLLSDKYDALIVEHEQSKVKIQKLEKIIANVNNKCVYLEKQNIAVEQKIHESEQVSRKHNIEIVGVEQLPGENVLEIVTKIGNVMNVSSTEIEWARRTRPTQVGSKPASIIVAFKVAGADTRDKWLAQRRKLSDSKSNCFTNGSATNKIYINEDLTKSTRALLWSTKKQLNANFKYIWVSNGRILVKKCDGEKAMWVRAESDLSDLIKNKQ